MVSLTPLRGVGIFFALSIRAPTHKYGRSSASTRVHALRFAWPRATMGTHKSGWLATFRIGRPLAYRSRGHLRKWASTIHEVGIRSSGNVAWPRATMGVHLSGWASNLRQLLASTHKDWASNFGGILVAHSQGLGFQLGWAWLSIVGRCGRPTWTRLVAQDGRMWASKMGGSGCQCGQDVTAQVCPLQDAHLRPLSDTHNCASIMGAHCWTAILWGYMVAHYWASIRAQLLGVHASPLWEGFLGTLFGRMWAHPNGTPTSLVHAASKWPCRCEPI